MPKTLTNAEYVQKPKEELEQLQQEWQTRAEQAPIPVGRGAWITAKATVAGVAATVPGWIAGFAIKENSLRSANEKAEEGLAKSIAGILKNIKGTVLKDGKITPVIGEEGLKHSEDLNKAVETIVKNAEKASATAKYSALAAGLGVAAVSAYSMVKRRRKIISDRADVEGLKITSALQGKALEEATEKAKHTASDIVTKLEKVQSAEKADHEKLAHVSKGEHEKPEHHEKKEHGDEHHITREDMDRLNERLAAKHGEAKEYASREHEKKTHAERDEGGHHR